MAFPSVVATNTGSESTNSTSHTINLPNGSNVTGRRLVVGFQVDGNGVSVTWPANWTEIAVGNGAAGNGNLHVAYHDIDGTEGYPASGATVSVTTGASEAGSHVSFLVDSFDAGTAPEALANSQSGTGTDLDPPSLTPTGGAKDYLWLAFGGGDGAVTVSAYPASYGDNITGAGTTAGGVAGGASRQLNAASENPGTFTVSGSTRRSGITVAIHPAVTGVTVTPGVGAVVIAGFAPVIGLPKTVAPGVGAVVISGFAPTINTGPTILPGVGSVVIAGFAPTIGLPKTVAPGVGAVVVAGFAPTITVGPTVRPGVGGITITGFAPTITTPRTVAPGRGEITITGFAPTISFTGEQVGWIEFDLFLDIGVGGTFAFQWAQNVAKPDSLVVKAGSYFEYARF